MPDHRPDPVRRRPRHRRRPRPRPRPNPRGSGFTADGLGPAYKLALPFRGPALRAYFNELSRGLAWFAALAGLIAGWALGGPLAALPVAAFVFLAAAKSLGQHRFFRP